MSNSDKQVSVREETISDVYAGASVISKLEKLIDKVTDKDCTPSTVQAAVNCVEAINGLLRTHLEQQRLTLEREKMRRSFGDMKKM